jgi:hypothetical protein
MKIIQVDFLIQEGPFGDSAELEIILAEIKKAIQLVTWPPESSQFTLYPVKQANGVVPIKTKCMAYLSEQGCLLGPLNAVGRPQRGRHLVFSAL